MVFRPPIREFVFNRLFQQLPSGPVLGAIGAVTLTTATATVLLVAGPGQEPPPPAPLSAGQEGAAETDQIPSRESPSPPASAGTSPTSEADSRAGSPAGNETPSPGTDEHSEHEGSPGQPATGAQDSSSSSSSTTTTVAAIAQSPSTTTPTPSTRTTTPTPSTPSTTHHPTPSTTHHPSPTTTHHPSPTTTQPGHDGHLLIERDTMIHEKLVLRAGDSIEFRNGARLMFGKGGYADWQGTPTTTWSNEGRVMNLNRDVEIFGDGDIMFMAGSLPSTIRYVEIDLQPKQGLGHYPLHFHLMGNDSRGSLVEGVVVKNSTNRAYVTHGSHGITVRNSIAFNIEGEAFWWDPRGSTDPSNPFVDDSHDTVWNRNLMVGITSGPLSPKFRMSAMQLGGGKGNVANHNVVINLNSAHGVDCSAFHWPEGTSSAVWEFVGNKAFGGTCNGIFVWQNTNPVHVVEDFTAVGLTSGQACIRHGAYSNAYQYIDVVCDRVEVLASQRSSAPGPLFSGGRLGLVVFEEHRADNPIHFENIGVGRVHIDNGRQGCGGRNRPGVYHFTNTGLSFSEVTTGRVCPGTTLTIDGVTRSFGG